VPVSVYWSKTRAAGALEPLLDAADQCYLAGLVSISKRDASATSRALLRAAAAGVLGIAPAAVRVTRSCPDCSRRHGKPQLPGTSLHVSATYTADRVAVAITALGPVGIDLERLDGADFDGFDGVALTEAEARAVNDLPALQRGPARARAWARKEAVLKASGVGLRLDPRAVPAVAIDLDLGPGYAAALHVATGALPHVQIIDADAARLPGWAASPRTARA
jgi:4'-phosphopantetheinyl transferase